MWSVGSAAVTCSRDVVGKTCGVERGRYVGPWDRGTRGSLPLLADADAAEAAVAMVEVEELEPPAAAPTAEAPASASPTTQAPGGGDVPTDDAAAADAPSAVDVVAVPEREELSWKVVCIMYGVGAAICAVFLVLQVGRNALKLASRGDPARHKQNASPVRSSSQTSLPSKGSGSYSCRSCRALVTPRTVIAYSSRRARSRWTEQMYLRHLLRSLPPVSVARALA